MTIPIQSVNVSPQFVQRQDAPGMEVLMRALAQRQEIELRKKKLAQDQEQFELNKRLAGSQIEGQDLINAERKAKLKKEADDIAARDTAHQVYTGNLTRVDDMKGWGEVIAAVKDPAVGEHLMGYIKELFTTRALATNWQTVGTRQGTYGQVNPETGETRQTDLQMPPDAGARRIPVVTEREKGSAAVSTIRANAAINRIETSDPTIGARVAAKAAVRRSLIGGIMRRMVGTSQEDANLLAEQQIEKSMTPDELEYYVSGKQLLSGILPGLSGKQVTAREYVMHAPAYLSMGSTSPQVIASRRKARNTRIRGFIAEAGDAMTERLPELADVDMSEYGFGPATASGGTLTPMGRKRRPENRH